MAKFIIDVVLDGYESEEEMLEAGLADWIYDQLNFSGSGVSVRQMTESELKLLETKKVDHVN